MNALSYHCLITYSVKGSNNDKVMFPLGCLDLGF